MSRIIGIDLGTTNTAVAVLEGGRPRVIEDERGYKVLPSVISAKGDNKFVVGQAAHNLMLTRPDRTVYATKRLIGRRFDSPEVQEAIRRVNYKVRAAADGGVELLLGEQWMTPTELAAVVLQVARGIAEKALGDKVTEAVITIPAYFNHAQRKATIEAAEMAGLRCERLLHEPTAAALAFGHRKNVERTILIFDLGGGTFDVSVLRLSSGIYETLATRGDSYLGGEDFDSRIVDHLVAVFKASSGVDLSADKNAVQRIRDAAERAKCELSFSDRAQIVIPHVTPQHSIEHALTRERLEAVTADLIDRCLDITRRSVEDAGLPLSGVDEVILVGGQTRMPRIREAIAQLLGREPSRTVHPEEAVAVGAAVHAANLAEGDEGRTVLLDVTPFDLGIDSAGGVFAPIVPRNSRVPASETRVFATATDNQDAVRVTVRQGESRVAADNEFLGEFVLTGLTPAPRMQTKVDVTFRIDGNGMLHVSALEKGSGERKNITIRNYAEHAASPRGLAAPETAPVAPPPAPAQSVAPAPARKPGLLSGILGSLKLTKSSSSGAPAASPAPAASSAPAAAPASGPPIPEGVFAALPPAPEAPAGTPGLTGAGVAEPTPVVVDAEALEMLPDDLPEALPEALPEPFDDDLPVLLGAAEVDSAVPAAVDVVPQGAAPETAAAPLDEVFAFGGEDDGGEPLDLPFPGEPEPAAAPLDFAEVDLLSMFDAAPVESPAATPVEVEPIEPEPVPPVVAAVPPDAEAEALPADWTDERPVELAPEDTFDFAFPEPEAPVDDPHEFMRRAFGTDAPGTSSDPDAQTPNEDDTAVTRRRWAWSEEKLEDARPARPVDLGPDPFARPADSLPPTGRKPARVRLRYPDPSRLGEEYRENLRKGGTFIKTPKPLGVGRECVCEVSAPGLDDTLLFPAVVTFVASAGPGQESGMGIEYRLSDLERSSIERVIERL